MKLKSLFATLIFSLLILLPITNIVSSYNDSDKFTNVAVKVIPDSHGFSDKKLFSRLSFNISLDEAKQIRQKLLDLESNSSGSEKILKQLQIMKNAGVILSNSTFNFLMRIIDSMNHSGVLSPCFNKTAFFIGPTIISHFTLDTRISAVLPIRRPLFYFPFIQKDNISGVAGALPYYFGKVNSTSYLTCVSYIYKESFDASYTSLRELMFPCIGISVAFLDNSNSESQVLSEYNLDYCHLAIIKGER